MNRFPFITAITLLGVLAAATQAQAPRPPAIEPTPSQLQITTLVPPQTELAAFLGVGCTAVSPELREKLNLKPGVGLVVVRVEKDSPAAQAGLKAGDLIQKLDDQWLIVPEQLAVLVRMHAAGDKVNLSIIREAQPISLTAALIEKQVPVISLRPGAIGGMDIVNPGLRIVTAPPINGEDPMQTILRAMGSEKRVVGTRVNNHELKLTFDKGEAYLVATDLNGELLFSGPVTTREQRDALPPDIARDFQWISAAVPPATRP